MGGSIEYVTVRRGTVRASSESGVHQSGSHAMGIFKGSLLQVQIANSTGLTVTIARSPRTW